VVLPCATAAAVVLAVVLPVSVVVACSIVGVTLWTRHRRRVRLGRRAAESEALQGALDVLVGELRVGAHPVAAFSVAATEADGAVAASLRAVAARARLGADVAAGLRSVARSSSQSAQWERLAVCWRLAEDHGLAIATLMQTAQRDIVERARFSAKVDAGMAGARTTAAVLAGLPLLGVGLGQLIGAEPVAFLLSGGVGGWLLVIGVALACGGLLWSDHITARVLT
jgi:tight adherence protein B